MDKETVSVIAFLYFVIGVVVLLCTPASTSFEDALTYAILWPAFVVKYFILGVLFLLDNGATLLFN